MLKKKHRIAILFGVLLLLVTLWIFWHPYWWDDLFTNYVLDNRYHHVSCEQLPSEQEIQQVLKLHDDVIHRIEAIAPSGIVGYEIVPCAPGHASLVFWYGSHQQRLMIEKIIGNDTFFGVPYSLENR